METSSFEQELARVIEIEFNPNDAFICLYFQQKLLSEEIYETLHQDFGSIELTATIEVEEDRITFSLMSETNLIASVNGLVFDADGLEAFKKGVRSDQRFTLFTGYILWRGEGRYAERNILTQQRKRFWLLGYRII